MRAMTTAIRFEDKPLIQRIARVCEGRGDSNPTKTARDLLHERLLELESHGDPVVIGAGVQRDSEKGAAA